MVGVNRLCEASETQVSQSLVHLGLVLSVEGVDVTSQDEQERRQVVGNNRPVVLIVGIDRAKLENPVRGGEGSSIAAVELDLQLTRIVGKVRLVGVTIDDIGVSVGRANRGIVVHTDSTIAVITVASGRAKGILLESGVHNLVGSHLVPKTEVLGDIQSLDGVRVDLGVVESSSKGHHESQDESNSKLHVLKFVESSEDTIVILRGN